MIVESRRLQMRNLWLVLLSSVTIAFAFAAPFLFLRSEVGWQNWPVNQRRAQRSSETSLTCTSITASRAG